MISLVVIIIVTVILIGIAVSAGYIYIERANELKRVTLSKTIGQVAAERQNNLATGTSDRFYEGYIFDTSEEIAGVTEHKYALIKNLPEEDVLDADGNSGGDGIPDCLQRPGSIWYLIDAESAALLDADGADQLLSRNIAYSEAFGEAELVRVVLVDYSTGDAYYVQMPIEVAKGSIKTSTTGCPNSPDAKHRFTIATCIEDSRCIYCGALGTEALGHDFSDATCEEPQKCRRCSLENGEPLGHLYVRNSDIDVSDIKDRFTAKSLILVANREDDIAWVTDAVKHWHECIRCGAKNGEEAHTKGFVDADSLYHEEMCTVCGWTSAKIAHIFDRPVSISDYQHTVKCKTCGMIVTHNEEIPSGNVSTNAWYGDHNDVHYRICAVSGSPCNSYLTVNLNGTTKHVVFKENHIDRDFDSICDVCGKNYDYRAPANFNDEDAGAYARVTGNTTDTISLEAYTIDRERRVAYYEFGTYDAATNSINWVTERVYVSSTTEVAKYTFKNLNADTAYIFYVRATDDNGNTNEAYRINGHTSTFPAFAGLINWPQNGSSAYVAPGHEVKVKEIETDLTEIRLNYYQNGTWISSGYNNGVELDDIEDIIIRLQRDNDNPDDPYREELKFQLIDPNGNKSQIWPYETDRVDAIAPKISIESKEGTSGASQLKHNALIVITDNKSGIKQGTEVKYAWSTSKTTAPTSWTTIHTENLDTASRVTYEVQTPVGVVGTYYLWVDKGVMDAVGNTTTHATCDNGAVPFIVDDTIATISDITMLNVTPAVPNEKLFVKTDGTVTITFKASKPLGLNPVVKINGVNVDSIVPDSNKINYTCKIKITDSFSEGILELTISEIMSQQGKLSDIIYTNADIANGQGPVYYDKTFPVMEYDPKYNH